jgi:hypothetical protein
MTDRELSTRDLADAADQSTERRTDMSDDKGADKTEPADEPLARERSEVDDDSSRPSAAEDEERGPLLPAGETDGFTTRWREVQTAFVDEPREAVARADALVAELMQRLATSFTEERQRLEGQWDRGDDVSTEHLRVALTRYRSFFDRLLSA